MERSRCPRIDHCAMIAGRLDIDENHKETFKHRFCLGDYDSCKRLIVIEKLHMCPDFVLPDSSISIDEVMEIMENEM